MPLAATLTRIGALTSVPSKSKTVIRAVDASALARILHHVRPYHRYTARPVVIEIPFPFGETYRDAKSDEIPDFWVVEGTLDGSRKAIVETYSEAVASQLAKMFACLHTICQRLGPSHKHPQPEKMEIEVIVNQSNHDLPFQSKAASTAE